MHVQPQQGSLNKYEEVQMHVRNPFSVIKMKDDQKNLKLYRTKTTKNEKQNEMK